MRGIVVRSTLFLEFEFACHLLWFDQFEKNAGSTEMEAALHLVPAGPASASPFSFEGAMGAADGPVAFVDQRVLGKGLYLIKGLHLFLADVQ